MVGGEIAVVVVDVDEIDVVALPGRGDDTGQRIDDVGDVGDQQFGVLVPVGIEHVDDEYRGVAHGFVLTPSPDLDT